MWEMSGLDMVHTKISAKGLLPKNRCGRTNSSFALFFKLSPSVFRPLAFSMIPLSIIVMIGATNVAAAPAAMASTPTLSPKFCVLHLLPPSFSIAYSALTDGVGSEGLGSVFGIFGFGKGAALQGPSDVPATLRMVLCDTDFGVGAGVELKSCCTVLISPIAASASD